MIPGHCVNSLRLLFSLSARHDVSHLRHRNALRIRLMDGTACSEVFLAISLSAYLMEGRHSSEETAAIQRFEREHSHWEKYIYRFLNSSSCFFTFTPLSL
ncbi:hypothetical protein CEXT_305491 [Caerostris extrusa]|uniref:Uncharacterized protein n=1 Tax=Caerostris extrusa TaxID=172846 RepID=A0AAV4WUV5_CAEEX|nr:hypothetical protein CEXT_305491 [Caerostris extrusa]